MEEEKKLEGLTEVISVSLEKWMDLHLQKVAVENELAEVRRRLWSEMSKNESLTARVQSLEKQLEEMEPSETKGIDLIDIARAKEEE